jgi:hypothetical protein
MCTTKVGSPLFDYPETNILAYFDIEPVPILYIFTIVFVRIRYSHPSLKFEDNAGAPDGTPL